MCGDRDVSVLEDLDQGTKRALIDKGQDRAPQETEKRGDGSAHGAVVSVPAGNPRLVPCVAVEFTALRFHVQPAVRQPEDSL